MTPWILTCPKCDTATEISLDLVKVECGRVSCTCTCSKCTHRFSGEQPYWRWLELDQEPPLEPEITTH